MNLKMLFSCCLSLAFATFDAQSAEVVCTNIADGEGKIFIEFQDNGAGPRDYLRVDLSQDSNGVDAPHFQGFSSKRATVSVGNNSIKMRAGSDFFNPVPWPNPGGGIFKPGRYAELDELKLNLKDRTMIHKKVYARPGDDENYTDAAMYVDCQISW